MGGNESKESDSKSSLHFSDEEKVMVSTLFHRISHGKKTFNREQFRLFTHGVLDPEICERLYELLHGSSSKQHHRGGHHEGEVDHHNFSHHLAAILKGGVSEQAELLASLVSPDHKDVLPEHLVKFVSSMVQSYEKILAAHCRQYQSWIFAPPREDYRRLALYMLEDLFCSGSHKDRGFHLPEVPRDVMFCTSDLEDWISKSTLFQQIFHEVFHACFRLYDNDPSDVMFVHPRIPQVCDTNWSKVQTILNLPSVLFLNASLPSDLQEEWRLLFSNGLHGDSFTQLVKILEGKGPTLLVLQDRQGHVFGGFASQPWNVNAKFYGDGQCYLFRLRPNYGVFSSSGYNSNFMYLNMNMQTLPNGLGMGGQLDYFGLWVADTFNRGHSKAQPRCTTYGSPQLSKSPEFEVDILEVWHVGPLKKKEDDYDADELSDEEAAKKSILDKDPEAKAMLELLGRGPVSEGLREGDETADTPEHSKVISLF
ncbi:MTOR-associated protein MEAK7-like [Babylonia areolata]|uniref:MTOR-associated protein MEAK7-like n=1 Tax=Babylonia areolata TaxID=304850 RepID=UPI003FD35080